MTEQLLDADTLPLVLLAALGHPDTVFRDRLRQRLDGAIEEAGPLHSASEVRQFLIDQPSTPLEPFYLEPPALELGIWIVRLVFSRRTRRVGRHILRIVSCDLLDEEGGLVFNHQLKPFHLPRRVQSTKQRPRRLRGEELDRRDRVMRKALRRYQKMVGRSSVFISGNVAPRLSQFRPGDNRIDAECRVADGFSLILRGGLPWPLDDLNDRTNPTLSYLSSRLRLSDGSTLGAHLGLAALGVDLEIGPGELRLRTTTPEAVIRFSACLTRGQRLVLRDSNDRTPGRIVVLLRDFDGDSARFPAVVSYAGAETWLRGLPEIPLHLDDDERLAIARWAYPPEAWLTNDLLENVI